MYGVCCVTSDGIRHRYMMEVVIANHAPDGPIVPAVLAFALAVFIALSELSKVG